MINFNPNVTSVAGTPISTGAKKAAKTGGKNFAKFVEKCISEVDQQQQDSNTAIKDLLSGKNQDITSVVTSLAKADISFKLLVGVRDKIIAAYQQTMNMKI